MRLLLLLGALLCATAAQAHTPVCRCQLEAQQISCQGGYDDGSSADGITNVAVRIDDEDNNAVGNTMLGNPVDIAFDGANLYVAEKSQGMVLRFDNILSSAGGDVSPDASIAQAAPESVVLIADYLGRAPE